MFELKMISLICWIYDKTLKITMSKDRENLKEEQRVYLNRSYFLI